MATLTETAVAVVVRLTTDAVGGKHVLLSGQSFDAQGHELRVYPETEVTGALSPAQQASALQLVNDAAAYLKSLWGIP